MSSLACWIAAPGIEKNALTIIAENANCEPGKIIAGTQRNFDENFNISMTKRLRFMDERIYLRTPLTHPAAFIPFDIYERVGNFDEVSYRRFADWDFFIRCYEKGVEYLTVPDVIVNCKQISISTPGSDNLVLHEQIALLHSKFPIIKNYNILLLLSSGIDKISEKTIKKEWQLHFKTGGKIPEKIMKGVYLLSGKTVDLWYEKWLEGFGGSQLQCIDDLYMYKSYSSRILMSYSKRGLRKRLIIEKYG